MQVSIAFLDKEDRGSDGCGAGTDKPILKVYVKELAEGFEFLP
jgi:hypothetical protein